MKPLGLLFAAFACLLLGACGSIRALEDLPCPCDTGYVCCDQVCKAEGSCVAATGSDCDADGVSCGGRGDSVFSGGTSSQGSPTAGDTTTSTIAGSADAGFTASEVVPPDAGTGAGASDSVYCSYASDPDAGAYVCSYNSECCISFFGCGCSGTAQGSPSRLANTELLCMSNGGSIVPTCPAVDLVGCCATPWGDGRDIACSYGAPMQDELSCVAAGGTWSVTAPR